MSIEQAIQQKKFRHEYEKLAVNISYTAAFFHHLLAEVLKPRELTQPQYNLLRILRGQYPNAASVNLLIERMIDRASNASRIVDKLEAKGLVTRDICPQDRRKMDVRITEAGLELLKTLDSELEGFYEKYHALSEKEARQLNGLLDRLREYC